jgi:imidazolonepropionase-like amidohydrolase
MMHRDIDSYIVLADVLVDGHGGEVLADPAITVEHGRIVAVETAGSSVGTTKTVMDYRGCSVAPGLVDSHVHLALRPELTSEQSITFVKEASEAEILEVMRESARAAVLSGVTTLRDCGSPGQVGVQLRERCKNDVAMPRILVSGRPLTTPGGHCHWMGRAADSSEDLCEAVRELDEEGVDFVKVMVTGGMMTPGSDPYRAQYSSEALTRLVKESHARGKLVAAHVLSAAGARVAIEASVDTIEHYTTITQAHQDFDPELIPAIVAAGIVVGITAHHSLRDLLRAGMTEDIWDRLAPHRALRQEGARTIVHSDAGTPGTFVKDFAESIEIYMLGMGSTSPEAIGAATLDASRAIGIGSEVGQLVPGKRADYVIVEGDLQRDIRALHDVRLVAKDGQIIDGSGQ